MIESDAKMSLTHLAEVGFLEPLDDGFYQSRCTCGWVGGVLPDLETTVDALMAHAYQAGAHEVHRIEKGTPRHA